MRVPKRRSETLHEMQKEQDFDPHLTPEAIERLKSTQKHAEDVERPAAIEQLRAAAEMGDFSENFAYQQAKANLRRINSRILSLGERIKRAVPIKKSAGGMVTIGSTVVLEMNGVSGRKTYQVVGSQETNPMRGRISHRSPIGVALLGRRAGETIRVTAGATETMYTIVEVR